jgi:transcriptional regulator with XRE-family HTH domain
MVRMDATLARRAVPGARTLRVRDPAVLQGAITAAGLSQARLAEEITAWGDPLLTVNKSTIGHLCTGYRTGLTQVLAEAVAEALDRPVRELFEDPNGPAPKRSPRRNPDPGQGRK